MKGKHKVLISLSRQQKKRKTTKQTKRQIKTETIGVQIESWEFYSFFTIDKKRKTHEQKAVTKWTMYGWLIAFPHGWMMQIVWVSLAFPSICSKCEPQWRILFKSTVNQINITNPSATFNGLFPNLDF